MESVTH